MLLPRYRMKVYSHRAFLFESKPSFFMAKPFKAPGLTVGLTARLY
jgi:hypothetical protein